MREPRALIVLAGGRSRRMGRDKARLPVGTTILVERIIGRLAPAVDQVIVAGGSFPDLDGVRLVADDEPGAGPLTGIAAGLRALPGEVGWVVACDLPDVDPRVGELLFALAADVDAVVPRPGARPEALCAVYHRRLVPRIERMLAAGEHRVRALLEESRVSYVDAPELRNVDPELRSFRNLNTPEEYRAWLDAVS
jgi:molybdopterin-guanine dinucleotide biosynthesis protein A